MAIFMENTSILGTFNWEKPASAPLREKKNIKVARTTVIDLFL